MPCFVIAEAGVNHNGRLDLALALVDAASDAGADAVKFQTFRADSLVKKGTAKAEYQTRETGSGDHHDMLTALELSESQHEAICRRCEARGIEFMSTPFDEWALELLIKLGVRRLKVPSGELTNRPFIEALARHERPLIVSTGMATLEEVRRTVDWLKEARPGTAIDDWLTLLHCTSNYPASPSDVNLRAMQTMQTELGVPVGYSDHTLGIEVSLAAVALGAVVIEKHFTLDTNLPGPDHKASLSPQQLVDLVRGIRSIEAALGDGIKAPKESERPIRELVRRSAFLARDLPAGHLLEASDVRYLRPGDGIGPEHSRLLGERRTSHPMSAGHKLRWEDLA